MSPQPAAVRPRPDNYSLNINGFRGVCVLLVFLHHVANSGLPPTADATSTAQVMLHRLFMAFGYGVELFFMISGYVIVNSLRRHATLSRFLLDRVIRIFPVWIPIAIFLAVVRYAAGHGGTSTPVEWVLHSLANLFLLPPLLPIFLLHPASWSLTYEWVFYGVAALAALLWRRGAPLPAKLVWAALAGLLIACYPRALFFLPGVLVALAPGAVRWLQRTPMLVPLTLLVFLFAWFDTGIFAAEFSVPLWSVLANGHTLSVLLAALAGTHVIACVAMAGTPAGLGALRTRAAQHLGSISYSFYLVHPVVMSMTKLLLLKLFPDGRGSWELTLVFAIVSGLLSWLVAYWSWRWLEQGLAKWLTKRWREVPATDGAYATAPAASPHLTR
ncbi:acyltransferase [Pseudorhodoferax sp. Leaf274]|uniref:acyltransferase family protein n=1 Tax=Pseudorhodoferax sp. Leaf274 TaxID=1736318 RepID=UPI00070346F4|nr:acyltransferase [Pseudorhodoferax sp. Leaf274]KQP43210.1 hypothetical protein ASF44_06480 [Pseudorhodoferax sp. Leaf274]